MNLEYACKILLEASRVDSLEGKKNKKLALRVHGKGIYALKKLRGSADRSELEILPMGPKKRGRGRPPKSDNDSSNSHASSSSKNDIDHSSKRVDRCSNQRKHSRNNESDNEDSGENDHSDNGIDNNNYDIIDSDNNNNINHNTSGIKNGSFIDDENKNVDDDKTNSNSPVGSSSIQNHENHVNTAKQTNQQTTITSTDNIQQPNSAEKSAKLLESIIQRKMLNDKKGIVDLTSNGHSILEGLYSFCFLLSRFLAGLNGVQIF